MRGTLRLFASVKPVRYLEAGAPTGLTGLRTNASPRSTLLYLYHRTLDKLADIPETSLYRQSVEAVTKHRLALVQATKPDGYDAWAAKAKATIEQHPEQFTDNIQPKDVSEKSLWSSSKNNFIAEREWSFLEGLALDGGKSYYLRPKLIEEVDERVEDAEDLERMDREPPSEEEEEAIASIMEPGQERAKEQMEQFIKEIAKTKDEDVRNIPEEDLVLETEPVLNADQYVYLCGMG